MTPRFPSFFLVSILLAICIRAQEDGFTFDTPEETHEALKAPIGPQFIPNNLQTAFVGKVFHYKVPHGSPRGFVAKDQNSKSLPSWLLFNKRSGIFRGVPLPGDEGTLHVKVTALGGVTDAETLKITVLAESADSMGFSKHSKNNRSCQSEEDSTVLTLLLDQNLNAIKPKQRVVAIENIAKFLSLPRSAFRFNHQSRDDDILDSAVVLAGPGNIQAKSGKKWGASLAVTLGCEGRLWDSAAPLIHNLKQQARDGTIAEVLRLPLIGWRVKTETGAGSRNRRQAADDFGSGDYDNDYYQDYEDDYNEEYDEQDLGDVEANPPTSSRPVTFPSSSVAISSTTSTSTTAEPTTTTSHPHRHHHGEPKVTENQPEATLPIEETLPDQSQTITQPPKDPGPTRIDILKPSEEFDVGYDYDQNYDDDDDEDDDSEDEAIESETVVPEVSGPVFNKPPETIPTTLKIDIEEDAELTTSLLHASTAVYSSTPDIPSTPEIIIDAEPPIYSVPATAQPEESTVATTTTKSESPSPAPTTTEAVTETVSIGEESPTTEPEQEEGTTQMVPLVPMVPEPKNTKPYIENRLQHAQVIAGKMFRLQIPKTTFRDAEDGYNLTFQVLDSGGRPLSQASWLQFNPARRELYGLPLPDDASHWDYIVRAADQDGAYEQDQLTIQVQQHRLDRVVNHEFAALLRIETPQQFPHYVDWSLQMLRALGMVYNTNMSEITVRSINLTSVPVVFAWSNDSLPTNYCPRQEILSLFKMLTANDRGDPSMELSAMLAPGLRVTKVLSHDLATCKQQPVVPATPVAPATPPAPVSPPTNFPPILRNPIDTINATLGELLVYKVQDDTFYDPEDVDPQTLNLTLLTSDRTPIPATSWLQFDGKNREFYGIPQTAGITEYYLICIDSGGMEGKDSLIVDVRPAAKRPYNVEFGMTIGLAFETFSRNAALQRKFVEKLMEILKESTPGNFHFRPFIAKRDSHFDSTAVYWFNKSLPVDVCPHQEIKQLERHLLHSDSRSISSTVHRIMGPEFTISTIKVHHTGNCKSKPPALHPTPEVQAPSAKTPQPQGDNDAMLIFVLPIVIISIMLFVACVAACLLYRRRRMGKMNVEEDGRQSYGNKGIPVIFQEELEEKPEAGTKAPVILQDEKPPLAPPEYSKSGSVKLEDSEPYHPPPPFSPSQEGRQNRPKPTPTYRKPPPYVPP